MLNIQTLRQLEPKILCIGTYPTIIQSMLDFDYLSGKQEPSVKAILVSVAGRNFERYFWGTEEILIPRYHRIEDIPHTIKNEVNLFFNTNSGRRATSTTLAVIDVFPNLVAGDIFAENMPEKNAIEIINAVKQREIMIVGPASVGLVIPQKIKLGAIAGLTSSHQAQSHLFNAGNIAVFAASGGMVGEIITVLAQSNRHLSFALHFGGDRFPVFAPREAFLMAEQDPETEYIVYYGELGGTDEYEVAQLMKDKKITKKVIAYIAGTISEMFETPPQFGHAKAMAKKGEETAQAKRQILKEAGAEVAATFEEFVTLIQRMPRHSGTERSEVIESEKDPIVPPSAGLQDDNLTVTINSMEERKKKSFVSSISEDKEGMPSILGEDILSLAQQHSFGYIVISMLLGKKIKSEELAEFTDFMLKLLVDHGPYQSGVVNTMVTARAGRDMVSSLVSGLLTIGPRFGGATNEAARNWLEGVVNKEEPFVFVERFVKEGKIIQGIGHLKYRADFPDPRVQELMKFAKHLQAKKYISFAQGVEKITTTKKGNLILNVDGAMAALLLDLLAEKEGLSEQELKQLIEIEFFNALFVLSRSVGFVAHYLDQKRLDEGLFRLGPDDVAKV